MEFFSGAYFPVFGLDVRNKFKEILRSKSPYSVGIQKNIDQKNSIFGHFPRWVVLWYSFLMQEHWKLTILDDISNFLARTFLGFKNMRRGLFGPTILTFVLEHQWCSNVLSSFTRCSRVHKNIQNYESTQASWRMA